MCMPPLPHKCQHYQASWPDFLFFIFSSKVAAPWTLIIQLGQYDKNLTFLDLILLKLLPISFENSLLIVYPQALGLLLCYYLHYLTIWDKVCVKWDKSRQERKNGKINREAKMNLAEICIGFVKSCHFPVTSRVSHLVFS